VQSVSAGWKESQQKTLVNESFIEIQLGLTDPEAVESAVPIATDVAPFAHLDQVVSRTVRNITPYATLERNLWVLDGSKKILPTHSNEIYGCWTVLRRFYPLQTS